MLFLLEHIFFFELACNKQHSFTNILILPLISTENPLSWKPQVFEWKCTVNIFFYGFYSEIATLFNKYLVVKLEWYKWRSRNSLVFSFHDHPLRKFSGSVLMDRQPDWVNLIELLTCIKWECFHLVMTMSAISWVFPHFLFISVLIKLEHQFTVSVSCCLKWCFAYFHSRYRRSPAFHPGKLCVKNFSLLLLVKQNMKM